jgi:mono/diheme cytochrome c family protein
MSGYIDFSRFVRFFGLGLLLNVAFGGGGVFADEEVTMGSAKYRISETIGSDEYRISCLNCHGTGGKGDGPMSEILSKKPSDLTMLAKNNGGEYPFLRVYQMIDGRVVVPGHGDRDMPIWGARYAEEDYERYGTAFGSEDVVRGRILQLVYYIQTLQEK